MNNFALSLRTLWDDIQSSLWFRPAAISVLASLLAIIAPYIDQSTSLKFYAIGADNARAVLSAIASSMLTVVTLTFSILMVALTLTSQQFSPRVLRSFTSNRTAQNILGILIGAFLYSLLVLVTVIDTGDRTFVPLLSVLIAIAFALVGIGTFIYFIDHIAKNIRVSYIIHTINSETESLLQNQKPDQIIGHQPTKGAMTSPVMDIEKALKMRAKESGYIQAIDATQLFTLAEEHGFTVQIVGMTGDFVAKSQPLLYIWRQAEEDQAKEAVIQEQGNGNGEQQNKSGGSSASSDSEKHEQAQEISDKLLDELHLQFDIGVERTMYEDLLFGLRQLVDIALKALSPGINDPTTATNCIDYLTNILIQAVNRPDEEINRYDENGNLCLICKTVTFEAMLKVAFQEIIHYGCSDPLILMKLISSLTDIASVTEDSERKDLIWRQASTICSYADSSIQQNQNRTQINDRLRHLVKQLDNTYQPIELDI